MAPAVRPQIRSALAVLLCASGAAGCAPAAGAPPVTRAIQPPSAACRPVHGAAELAVPGRVLVLGERHGTTESPALVADVLCTLARARVPVTLGVELPADEQVAIDRFLASPGAAADRAALTRGPFWHTEHPDGRSSVAMVALLERARALRASRAPLRVVAYAAPAGVPFREHDRAMSDALSAAAGARPGDALVVLTGNVHARLVRGTSFDTTFAPMAHLLAGAGRDVVSLDMAHDGGEAWTCQPTSDAPDGFACGRDSFEPEPGADPWTLRLSPDMPPDAPYHGRYGVGRITASPPALARE